MQLFGTSFRLTLGTLLLRVGVSLENQAQDDLPPQDPVYVAPRQNRFESSVADGPRWEHRDEYHRN